MAILTYEGYTLFDEGVTYMSCIDGKTLWFDTAGQWVQYINYIKGRI